MNAEKKTFAEALKKAGYTVANEVQGEIHCQPANLLNEKTKNFAALSVPGLEKATARIFSAVGGDVLIVQPKD